jgi:hypothetical protein
MNNDKINRSRPGRASRAALVARHARKCVICKHPDREAIEEQFVHWIHADRIVEDHDLPSQTNLYRHARATGLFNLRRCNVRSALEHLIEESIHAPVTGDTVIRAIRALVHINAKGRWIEPPKELVLSRRDLPVRQAAAAGQSLLPPGHLESANAPEPATRQLTGKTVQEMEPATRDSVSLSLPQRPNGPSITDFLIDSPKRLENAATQTKQTTDAISNRMKIDPFAEADHAASAPSAAPGSWPLGFADTPRTRRIGQYVVQKPKQSESP